MIFHKIVHGFDQLQICSLDLLCSGGGAALPALVLPKEGIAVGAVVLCHVEARGAEWDEGTRDAHSDEAETGAEGPGEDTRARLGPCPHMMLAVDARQVHRVITELCRNH